MHTYNYQNWLIYTLIGQHWLITKLIDQQILMTKLDSSCHGFGGRRAPSHLPHSKYDTQMTQILLEEYIFIDDREIWLLPRS